MDRCYIYCYLVLPLLLHTSTRFIPCYYNVLKIPWILKLVIGLKLFKTRLLRENRVWLRNNVLFGTFCNRFHKIAFFFHAPVILSRFHEAFPITCTSPPTNHVTFYPDNIQHLHFSSSVIVINITTHNYPLLIR